MSPWLSKWLDVACVAGGAVKGIVGAVRPLGGRLHDGATVVLPRRVPVEIRTCSPLPWADLATACGGGVGARATSLITAAPVKAVVVDIWVGRFVASGSDVGGVWDPAGPSVDAPEGRVDGARLSGRCVEVGRLPPEVLYVSAGAGCKWIGWRGNLPLPGMCAS
jgi:hypothetical protein